MSVLPVIEQKLARMSRIATTGHAIGLHIRFAAPLMTFFSYPEAWQEHYTSNTYGLRDPIIGWGFSEVGTCRWSALTIPDPFNILGQGAAYGLRYGVAISCGPITSRTIAGLARPDREFTDPEIAELQALIAALHDLTEPPASLTPSQREALQLIAGGDRHTAAAAKLGISESALKARLNSARQRLMARTTAEAIQRAKEYRLL